MAEEAQAHVTIQHDLAPALDISRRPGEGRRDAVVRKNRLGEEG
jgi:hypothetical protein